MKHYAPGGNKVQKSYTSFVFLAQRSRITSHKVIDLGTYHLKGVSSEVSMPNMKTLSFMVQKL